LILTLLGLYVTKSSLQGNMHTGAPESTIKARVGELFLRRHVGDNIVCIESCHVVLCALDFISVLLLTVDGL